MGETGNPYRIPVSAASIILVFPPRVIVITQEAWAARCLGVGPQRLKEERRDPRVLKKKIHGW